MLDVEPDAYVELLARRLEGVGVNIQSPYRGLAAFEDSELDALYFFGRERDTEIVVANLIASRFTVLYGPSGVGKSSLLLAAVARDAARAAGGAGRRRLLELERRSRARARRGARRASPESKAASCSTSSSALRLSATST